MSDTRTSIIVPAYGHEGMTRNCVLSALATTPGRSDVEIIVVDDFSPKPITLEGVDDPRARVVRTPGNLRFSRACNFGADHAAGDRLLFLNNDTEPKPGWLQAMEDCLDEDPTIAIVGARLLYQDGTIQHAGVTFSQRDHVPRHVYRGFPGSHEAVSRDRDFKAVTAACMLMRRDVYLEAGGFDAGFDNGYEDIDLCMRSAAAGHRVRYCARATVHHFESVSRRDEIENLRPDDDANLKLFMSRWGSTKPDEFDVYLEDRLIRIDSGEIYPLTIEIDPLLGIGTCPGGHDAIVDLLNIRSRQVFDLRKEVGSMVVRLLDEGLQP